MAVADILTGMARIPVAAHLDEAQVAGPPDGPPATIVTDYVAHHVDGGATSLIAADIDPGLERWMASLDMGHNSRQQAQSEDDNQECRFHKLRSWLRMLGRQHPGFIQQGGKNPYRHPSIPWQFFSPDADLGK